MKKWVCVFLATLVVSLSMAPDLCSCQENFAKREQKNAPSDDCPDEQGVCSPFMVCSCCIGFTIPVLAIDIPAPLIGSVERPVFCYHLSTLSEFFILHWQPPQV
ncbi:MAG: hypothetical protein R2822_30115 [Spirosomataceae bacterium]|jgi:hypothetical protein